MKLIDRNNLVNSSTSTSLLFTIRTNVLYIRIHKGVDHNTSDASLDGEITNTTKLGSNDVRSKVLRKRKNDICHRNRICNRIMQTILLEEDINLVTIRINQVAVLHGEREFRALSNILRNNLLKHAVIRKVLMHRKSHTNNRVIRSQRSVLTQRASNCRDIILKQSIHHLLMILYCIRIILEMRIIRVIRLIDKHITHSFTSAFIHEECIWVTINIYTTFTKSCRSNRNKLLCQRTHGIGFVCS